MQDSKIYINTKGLNVLIRCNANLAGTVETKFKVRKPDGSETEWPADPVVADETGILSWLSYTTLEGDLNQVGEYIVQPFVAYSAGFSGKGTPVRLRVWPKWR